VKNEDEENRSGKVIIVRKGLEGENEVPIK
jgi:hypothetical protein